MAAQAMDGRGLAREILAATAQRAARLRVATGQVPTLATVIIGDDPASQTYVRMKKKRCDEIGLRAVQVALPRGTTTAEAVAAVRRLADDPTIHALLVQHPVPEPIDRRVLFETVPLAKDVDGVTAAMLGRVILGLPALVPCTPAGILRLLRAYAVPLEGAHAVVIGRSPIIGRPLASLLINAHATVTLCHSRTRALPDLVRQADLVIAAVGRPRFVQGDWLKRGAIVVDAGYNEGNLGDVDYEAAAERAAWITPVPGGVGPMTIAMLLANTVTAAEMQSGFAVSD